MTISGAFPADESAAGWSVAFDSPTGTGYTTISIELPDGWADGELYLAVHPFGLQVILRPVEDGKITVKNSELGARGYVYAISKTDAGQTNTPIITYRVEKVVK